MQVRLLCDSCESVTLVSDPRHCLGTTTTSRYSSVTFPNRQAVITLLKEVLFSRCTKILIAQLISIQAS